MDREWRQVDQVLEPRWVREGAGVRLRRSIGARELDMLDPFLLLDHFESEDPAGFEAGFPMHPHRGIETVTYMLAGEVQHRDVLGNEGVIGPGGLQWMTAGRAIMHEEMPRAPQGRLNGFQLWVNLPARLKMMEPRYQELRPDEIPETRVDGGGTVRVIAGSCNGVPGPVKEIAARPTYLDVAVDAHGSITQPVERGHNVFAYVFNGEGWFGVTDDEEGQRVTAPRLVVWGEGDRIRVQTGDNPARFLLVSGKPLNEPVARYGPFVMNTTEEIQQTLRELREGIFIKT